MKMKPGALWDVATAMLGGKFIACYIEKKNLFHFNNLSFHLKLGKE